MTFEGFPRGTTQFLAELSKHNDKAWFDRHREDYQACYVEPAKAFVEAMAPKLKKLSADVHAEPRVNGSIFRINRDVRFSKDKRPYKDHLDLWFWQGPEGRRSKECPGYFFRMTPTQLYVGAGMHQLDKKALDRYRARVADDASGRPLEAALKKATKLEGARVGGETYKRVPKGYDPEHPRAALLRHSGLFVEWLGPIPKEATTPGFTSWVVERYRAFAPVQEWLVEHVAA